MRRLIVFLSFALSLLGTSALADFITPGDTLYRHYNRSRGMVLYPDGGGGIGGGVHVVFSTSDALVPFRLAPDGTPIGNWIHYGEYTRTVGDGQGGAYLEHGWSSDIELFHQLPLGGYDPAFGSSGFKLYLSSSGLGFAYDTAIASDDSGGVYVAACLDDARLIAWRVLGNATIAPGWDAAGNVLRDITGDLFYTGVVAAADGANGALIGVANSITSGSPSINIRAYRVGPTGLRPWSRLVTTAHTTGGPMFGVLAAGDHAFYCWANDLSSTTREIRLQSLAMSTGLATAGWPATGIAIAQGKPDSVGVKLLADGEGGVYVVWQTPEGFRAQHVTSAGTLTAGWPEGGVSLIDAAAAPEFSGFKWPDMIAVCASSSELIAAWTDARNPGISQVRARWLLPDATVDPAQPDTGRIVGPSLRAGALGAMSDGAHGAYIGWEDRTWPQLSYNSFMLTWVPYVNPTGVPPTPRPQASGLSAWPNPARDAVSVRFSSRGAPSEQLELIDVAGHRVRTLESAGAGERTARFEGLAKLPSGVYFVRLAGSGATRVARVAIVH